MRSGYVFIMMTVLWVLFGSGCRRVNDTIYSHYSDIPADGWNIYDTRCFEPEITDTTLYGAPVSLTLAVRYDARCPSGEIPVRCDIADENGDIRTDTVRLRLFDENAEPIDPARYGICEHTVTLSHNMPLKRGLSVCLTPLSGKNSSQGLRNVGIKIDCNESDSASR